MSAQPSPSPNTGDTNSLSITDLVLQKPAWKEYIFPKLAAIGEVTIVSMNEGVDGAPFASVCAIKAASGGTLPMFGKSEGRDVHLLIAGLDTEADADLQAFQQVLLNEEKVHSEPDQWAGALRVRKQGHTAWDAVHLDTEFSVMKKQFAPNSFVVIYDLSAWLTSGGLTAKSASQLLANFRKECAEKCVTLLIFERHSSDKPTLAKEMSNSAEVLQLVANKKGPSLTGSGCILLRKRRGYFDTAPCACSFWISLTGDGTLTWGMEPSEGPQLAQRELDAAQRSAVS